MSGAKRSSHAPPKAEPEVARNSRRVALPAARVLSSAFMSRVCLLKISGWSGQPVVSLSFRQEGVPAIGFKLQTLTVPSSPPTVWAKGSPVWAWPASGVDQIV